MASEQTTVTAVNGVPLSPLDVLTLAQAAEYLQLPEDAVRAEAEAGRLVGRQIRGDWRFVRDGIAAWLRTPERKTLADFFRDYPSRPWTPEVEKEAEAEIAALYALRRSYGTVGGSSDDEGPG